MFASFSRPFRLNPRKRTKPRPRQEHVQYPSHVYLRNPFPGEGASKRAGVKHQRRRGLRRPKRTPRSPPFRGPGRRDSERSRRRRGRGAPAPTSGSLFPRRPRAPAPHAGRAAAQLAPPPRMLALSALTRATGKEAERSRCCSDFPRRGAAPQLVPVTAETSAPSSRAGPRGELGEVGGGWSGRKETRGRRGASCSPPPRASAAARLVTAAPTGRLRARCPPLTCRRRLWAALTGASLVRDRDAAAAASAAPRARRPAPGAQAAAAAAVAAAAALRPPPPEGSSEQAAEALKAGVQPSEDRAQQIASDSLSPGLKNRHLSRSPRPPCSPPRLPPPPPPPTRGPAPFAPRPAPPRPLPAARPPAALPQRVGLRRPVARELRRRARGSAPPARRARRARSCPAPSAGRRPAPARVLTKCGKRGPNSSPPLSTPPRPCPPLGAFLPLLPGSGLEPQGTLS
ncbi:hypothetical protein P7K49_028622 [Saguinus oedipus]|uniref:Basic proline-rich protein-like n=1 Tax=Saguinus oedipus TaxID=9490 RepID=A0ABQ9U5M6_SAGOE|nr:hypothetical protein P7K49_028622 [Saguinus oedipus]